MAESFTSNKHIGYPAVGDTSWGTTLNTDNWPNADAAFGTNQAFNLGGVSGTVAVTGTAYVGAYPANTASYIPPIWTLSGALAGNTLLQLPASVGGIWIVKNGTSGAYTVTVQTVSAGASAVITQGTTRSI